MKPQPAATLLGLAAMVVLATPACARSIGDEVTATPLGSIRMRMAQATDAGVAPSSPGTQGGGSGTPGDPAAPPSPASPASPAAVSPPAAAVTSAPTAIVAPVPPVTATTRNGSVPLPSLAQPGPGQQGGGTLGGSAPTISYGGPQTSVQPVYGSALRDSGAGNNGVPVYSTAPSTLGGPINGTANAYLPTTPNGGALPGQGGSGTTRGTRDTSTIYTQQPLGAVPNTRDQAGTFGGRGGYNAQGIYNGTAAGGAGYGSPYAPIGRPTGGLLSTNVDATGPLRPYIPLNNDPAGRPNSGYGTPNGSRPSHIDGRGIQRMD